MMIRVAQTDVIIYFKVPRDAIKLRHVAFLIRVVLSSNWVLVNRDPTRVAQSFHFRTGRTFIVHAFIVILAPLTNVIAEASSLDPPSIY